MNENELRELVVSTAQKYLGCNGKDGTHRPIIDIYNAKRPLPRGYPVKYIDAWCATFVSTVSILCGLTDIIPQECGCGEMIRLYQQLRRWQESDAYVPRPGDIIFYDWSDNGQGDNTGAPDHVGIVVRISGGIITVIEGNKGNAVGYRDISINGRYIRGYGVPNYATKADKPAAPTQDYREDVKARFGLADETVDYLAAYKYGTDLLRKLATQG